MPTEVNPAKSDARVMIITGASSGIGAALALRASASGYRVLLVARREDRLREVAASVRARGGICEVLVADVVATGAALRIVDAALHAFGRIDVVVNNAGVGAPGTLLDQSDTAIDAQFQLHVGAPLRITRAALPQLRENHGGVVILGSGLARVPAPGFGAYCLAKAAARAAAIQLRRELRGIGVAVTYVDPGVVDTEFSDASGMKRSRSSILARPDRVAARIVAGIERRAASVNAVPWQTAGVVLAEWFPTLADATLLRLVDSPAEVPRTQGSLESSSAVTSEPSLTHDTVPAVEREVTDFERALEPVARRMERVKLTPEFIHGILTPGATLDLHDVAMRWAGMPNKNERAALNEVFDALVAAEYLQPSGEEKWLVLRSG